jgi:hypothetical protein
MSEKTRKRKPEKRIPSSNGLSLLRGLVERWRGAALWEHDDMGNVQSAQSFDQCALTLCARRGPTTPTRHSRELQETR